MTTIKCILVASCLLCVFFHVHGQQQQSQAEFEQQMKKAQQMTQSCQKLVQATESDMKEFQMQKKPSTKTGKCMHACLMESIGLIVDGKLSTEKSTELISQLAQGNNELLAIAKDITNDCLVIEDDDRCEMAFKLMSCTEEAIQSRNIDMRKFMPQQQQQQEQQQQWRPPQQQQQWQSSQQQRRPQQQRF